MKRAVMTGGRKWPFHHRPEMRASLLLFRGAGVERLGQGEARGADRLAAELWAELGGEVVPYEANWRPNGYVDRTAGHRRNIEMIETEQPDVVLGYPDEQSSGTWHCIAEALRRDIPCAVLMPWADGRHAAIVAALRGISRYAPDIIERLTYLIHGSDPHLYLGSPGKVQETWSKVQASIAAA